MKAFLVANPKGGSGKSTLATNLAGYFANKGNEVMLGDIDRQQSSREWLGIRPFALPTIDTWAVGEDKVCRPPKGTSHAVLDTPAGLHGKQLERVLKLSTRVIVPVQPSMFDMLATRHFLTELLSEKAIRKGKADVAVIGRPSLATTARGIAASGTRNARLPVFAVTRSGSFPPALTTMVSGPGQNFSARRSNAVSRERASS